MATEKRLIDANALIKEMNAVDIHFWNDAEDGVEMCVNTVHNAPTVDAVEVVRCKKCKYWERLTDGNLCGACNGQRNGLTYEYTTEDDFCSYGERREGE
jgi:hypothetical protein